MISNLTVDDLFGQDKRNAFSDALQKLLPAPTRIYIINLLSPPEENYCSVKISDDGLFEQILDSLDDYEENLECHVE